MNKLKISQKGIELIKQFEGCVLRPYLDAVGVATIGFGNTTYEDGAKVKLSDPPISQERANRLMLHLLPKYEKAVHSCVRVPITQNQFDALVSFCWNVGGGNLTASTLVKKLNRGDVKGAGDEFLRWNKAKGKVLAGLTRRRQAERALFLR